MAGLSQPGHPHRHPSTPLCPHLHAQADGVQQDQEEHEVLEVGGGDHVPDLVLVGVLGDVAAQRASLQRVLHTLALGEAGREGGREGEQCYPTAGHTLSTTSNAAPPHRPKLDLLSQPSHTGQVQQWVMTLLCFLQKQPRAPTWDRCSKSSFVSKDGRAALGLTPPAQSLPVCPSMSPGSLRTA